MAIGPCLNPNCSSNGRPHPNCKCYSNMAEGGVAGCNGPHEPKCEYHIPSDTSEVFHNAVSHHGLSNLIKQSSKSDLDNVSKNPHRGFDSYIDASRKGAKKYSKTLKSTLNKEKSDLTSNPDNLAKHLDTFKSKPESMIEVGSAIGRTSPDHTVDLGAAVGSATSYLESIKPKPAGNGPLSEPLPISASQKAGYDRQLHIVEQPLSVIDRIKNGSLSQQDTQTLTAVYPKMYDKLKNSVMEEIINARSDGKGIPYHTKLSLSLFLGQPMDSSLDQSTMQAAMQANASKGPPQPPQGSKKPSKPSLAQQEKLNGMFATETQKLQGGDKE